MNLKKEVTEKSGLLIDKEYKMIDNDARMDNLCVEINNNKVIIDELENKIAQEMQYKVPIIIKDFNLENEFIEKNASPKENDSILINYDSKINT